MTEQDLLDYIKQHAPEPVRPRPPGFGVTVAEYAAAENIGKESARKLLEGLTFERLLECRRMSDKGGAARPFVYARPGEWEKMV
jgi:hypothetical protein